MQTPYFDPMQQQQQAYYYGQQPAMQPMPDNAYAALVPTQAFVPSTPMCDSGAVMVATLQQQGMYNAPVPFGAAPPMPMQMQAQPAPPMPQHQTQQVQQPNQQVSPVLLSNSVTVLKEEDPIKPGILEYWPLQRDAATGSLVFKNTSMYPLAFNIISVILMFVIAILIVAIVAVTVVIKMPAYLIALVAPVFVLIAIVFGQLIALFYPNSTVTLDMQNKEIRVRKSGSLLFAACLLAQPAVRVPLADVSDIVVQQQLVRSSGHRDSHGHYHRGRSYMISNIFIVCKSGGKVHATWASRSLRHQGEAVLVMKRVIANSLMNKE